MLLHCDVLDKLRNLRVECLAIIPQRDRLVCQKAQRELAAGVGERNVRRINGPHLVIQTRPEEVLEVILEFAAGIDGPFKKK